MVDHWPNRKTPRAERSYRESTFTKCWCGNVAGRGEWLCGRHRNQKQDEEQELTIEERITTLEQRVEELFGARDGVLKW